MAGYVIAAVLAAVLAVIAAAWYRRSRVDRGWHRAVRRAGLQDRRRR